MDKKPQVLIKLKNGEQVIFDIQGHYEFLELVEEISKLFTRWIFIGKTAAFRRSEIASLFFLSEGYENRKSYSQ